MKPPERRVLVLGLDGATFDLLDPLFEAGKLPFLASLSRRGFRAPLRSVYPAKTIPAWWSFATGRDPGELGTYGFTEPDGGPGRSRFVQTFRPAEAIWDRLSRVGVRVGVLNFPLRRPYPLNGFFLPGFLDDGTTHPRSLRGEVEELLGGPYPGEMPVFHQADREAWVARATRATEQRATVAADLARRERPGFLFTLFRETDRVEHQLWGEMERPVDAMPDDLLRFWEAVDRGCRDVDEAFRSAGGAAMTLVISDHGHGAIRSDFLTNRFLAEERFLLFRDRRSFARRRVVSRLVFFSQRFAWARSLRRAVAEFLRRDDGSTVARWLGSGTSFEEAAPRIDWERTLAYSYPTPEAIYVNPYNPHLDAEARRRIVARLRARLEAFDDAAIEVLDPKVLYPRQRDGRAPDLLIRIDGMETEPRMDFAYPQPLIRDRPDFFYGSGTHRMNGILIGAGDAVAHGGQREPLRLLDLAPTILETMGVELPEEFAGRSFASALGLGA